MIPSLYAQTRKHCLELAEPFRGMPPCMFADQGGFGGLIVNLEQSIDQRPPEAQQAVRDFVDQLRRLMQATEHLKTDDKNMERRIDLNRSDVETASKLRASGMGWEQISSVLGSTPGALKNAVSNYRKTKAKK